LESGTRVESKKLEGESEEGPLEILLLPILSAFLGSIFKPPWILREVKERRGRGGAPRFEAAGVVHDRGERKEGVKEDSFYCGPTG
jgi:hypothetical protein